MNNLSIVIPAFNEAESLPELLNSLSKICKKNVEVILVDNGSNDNTSTVANSLAKKFRFLRVVSLQKNQGYGGGILAGLRTATGTHLAWTHADLQTDLNDVLAAWQEAQNSDNDLVFVKGVRKKRGLLPSFLSLFMQIVASTVLNIKLKEINAQPKLFSRQLYQRITSQKPPVDFSLDLFFYVKAIQLEAEIIEIPVYFSKRKHGVAKGGGSGLLSVVKISLRAINYIFNLKKTIVSK